MENKKITMEEIEAEVLPLDNQKVVIYTKEQVLQALRNFIEFYLTGVGGIEFNLTKEQEEHLWKMERCLFRAFGESFDFRNDWHVPEEKR